MPLKKQFISRLALYLTGLTIVLALVSPFIFLPAINSPFIKTKISQIIESKTGVVIDGDKFFFKLNPMPGIRMTNIGHAFNDQLSLTIEAIDIDINLVQLLIGEFAVSRIKLKGPHLQYAPEKENKLPSPVLSRRKEKSNMPEGGKDPLQFAFPKKPIERLFSLFPDTQKDIGVTIEQFKTDYFTSMDGKLAISAQDHTLTMDAKIYNINIAKNQFPADSMVGGLPLEEMGFKMVSLDLKLTQEGKLIGRIKASDPRVVCTPLPASTLTGKMIDLSFLLSREDIQVRMAPADISYPRARIGADFSLNRNTGQAGITFSGKKIDIAQAGEVCLALGKTVPLILKLFDILRGGTAENIQVGFKSDDIATLFAGTNLVLEGNAAHARIKIPEVPLLVENVAGHALIKKGVLHVQAKKGEVSSTQLTGGNLELDLMNYKTIPFKGSFTLAADLNTLPELLISLLPGTLLAEELARIEEISGQADAVLNLDMPLDGKELLVGVQAKNISAAARYDRLPFPATITRGSLDYQKNRINLKGIAGTLGGSTVADLDMEFTMEEEPAMELTSDSIRINLAEVSPWALSHKNVKNLLSPALPFDGTLTADKLWIRGPVFSPEDWKFDVQGQGKDIALALTPSGYKSRRDDLSGFSGSFHLSDKGIKKSDIKGRINDLAWLSPIVDSRYLASIRLPLTLRDTKFTQNQSKTFFQGSLVFPTGPNLSFNLVGKGMKDLFPRVISLVDKDRTNMMILPYKDPSKPLMCFDGKLNTETLESLLVKNSFLYDTLLSFTVGEPITFYTDDNADLHISTRKFKLDKFLGALENSPPQSSRPMLGRNHLFFKTDRLSYENLNFNSVKARITFRPGSTLIEIGQAFLCELSTTGQIKIEGKNQTKATTAFKVQALEKENAGDLMDCLFQLNSLIKGPYSFTAGFKGSDNADLILKRLNGELKFHSDEGRIFKATLLSRVLSVLNILDRPDITQEGFGYKTFEIEAEIKNSVIHLKKAFIDADDMLIIFNGWLDPLNDKLELTILVAPFKTIDTIIQHLPVVNTIFSGRLVSFPAKASGKISDPDVVPLHPADVSKSLIKALGDFIQSPARLLTPQKTNSKAK